MPKFKQAANSQKTNRTVSKTITKEREEMRKSGLKKRAKPGSVALREVKRYQRSVNLVIPKAPFARVVR